MSLWRCVHLITGVLRGQRHPSETAVVGGCGPPDTGVGTWTWLFCSLISPPLMLLFLSWPNYGCNSWIFLDIKDFSFTISPPLSSIIFFPVGFNGAPSPLETARAARGRVGLRRTAAHVQRAGAKQRLSHLDHVSTILWDQRAFHPDLEFPWMFFRKGIGTGITWHSVNFLFGEIRYN